MRLSSALILVFLSPSLAFARNELPKIELPVAPSEGLIKRSKRVQAFEVTGLDADLSAMDELDRDMLAMRASRLSFNELAEKYPQLPPMKLKNLQKMLKGDK